MVVELKALSDRRRLFRAITTQSALQEYSVFEALLDQINLVQTENVVKWRWSEQGKFSTKDTYRRMAIGAFTSSDLKSVWTVKIPLKMTLFLWIFKQKKVLTRGYNFANRCFMCCGACESCDHLIAECDYTRRLWSLFKNSLNPTITIPETSSSLL
ncbi:hypothetical protein LUZ60_001162 [Juncus effusus]|nr:hypothetical protein LUZ60_001162 [Juncus effusus]